MNPCHGCGLDPALYSNTVFGFAGSAHVGFYEVECQCRRTSGRFLRSSDAVAEWNRRNPRTGGVVEGPHPWGSGRDHHHCIELPRRRTT